MEITIAAVSFILLVAGIAGSLGGLVTSWVLYSRKLKYPLQITKLVPNRTPVNALPGYDYYSMTLSNTGSAPVLDIIVRSSYGYPVLTENNASFPKTILLSKEERIFYIGIPSDSPVELKVGYHVYWKYRKIRLKNVNLFQASYPENSLWTRRGRLTFLKTLKEISEKEMEPFTLYYQKEQEDSIASKTATRMMELCASGRDSCWRAYLNTSNPYEMNDFILALLLGKPEPLDNLDCIKWEMPSSKLTELTWFHKTSWWLFGLKANTFKHFSLLDSEPLETKLPYLQKVKIEKQRNNDNRVILDGTSFPYERIIGFSTIYLFCSFKNYRSLLKGDNYLIVAPEYIEYRMNNETKRFLITHKQYHQLTQEVKKQPTPLETTLHTGVG